MNKLQVRIRKPDDSGAEWTTEISSDMIPYRQNVSLYGERNEKDPIHASLVAFWTSNLKRRTNSRRTYRYFALPHTDFSSVISIGGCLVAIGRTKNRLSINGSTESLATVANALARLTLKSVFEKDTGKLLKSLYSSLSMPENVKYCIENRIPFHFFDDFTKIQVRLNCQQISDNEIAIEIADGVWGTMTFRELDSYCGFYLNGKKNSKKWTFVSPELLYERTMKEKPKLSDMKVMKEFLKQNRQQNIVEARAITLVKDIAAKYPDRIRVSFSKDGKPQTMLVRGTGWDWKLTDNQYKSDIQAVSTYVWSTPVTQETYKEQLDAWAETEAMIKERNELFVKENPDMPTTELMDNLEESLPKPVREPKWKGPICIDNMTGGSSVGDQFVARALALLNDVLTVKRVNTINRYLNSNENEYRVDMDEMQ
tara:strand:+ start:2659 stop:3936 length:1278 start_codon:yes stop_codon:yes gene_type:complete